MAISCSSSSSSLPLGYKFKPTDEELLKWYLERKVDNKDLPSDDAIIVEDVYAKEPWLLMNCEQDCSIGMGESIESYFFVKREPLSMKNEKGKRVRRDLKGKQESRGGGGWWHANTGDMPVKDDNNEVVGFKKMLKFHCYNNNTNNINKKRERNEANSTNWIMHEYRLPRDTFQEWVICRIKLKPCQEKTTLKRPTCNEDDEFQSYFMNVLC